MNRFPQLCVVLSVIIFSEKRYFNTLALCLSPWYRLRLRLKAWPWSFGCDSTVPSAAIPHTSKKYDFDTQLEHLLSLSAVLWPLSEVSRGTSSPFEDLHVPAAFAEAVLFFSSEH